MLWQSNLFSRFSNLFHGSASGKQFGVTAFGHAADEIVVKNRKTMTSELGFDLDQAVFCFQSHGNDVEKVLRQDMGRGAYEKEDWLAPGTGVDAMITSEPGPVLISRTADCVPILFSSRDGSVIGVAHAGWKGTIKKIVQRVSECFKNDYNIDSSGLFCAIGPSISGEKYDISQVFDDRLTQFKNVFGDESGVICESNHGISINLPLANKILLTQAGIPEDQIEIANLCTYQSSDWASYRRSEKELASPIWTYIGIKEKFDTL